MSELPEPSDRRSSLSTRPISTGRTGLLYGLIVAMAMLGAFAYFWKAMGAPDAGRIPSHQAVDSLP